MIASLFIEILKQLNSSVFILLGLLVLAFVATWKLAALLTKIKYNEKQTKQQLTDTGSRVAQMEDEVTTLTHSEKQTKQQLTDTGSRVAQMEDEVTTLTHSEKQTKQQLTDTGKKLGNIESALGKLTQETIALRVKVDFIYESVNPNSPVKNSSPLSLTQKGEEIRENINASKIAQQVYEKLKEEFLEKNVDKNAYQIQQAAMHWAKHELQRHLTQTEQKAFYDQAYEYGLLVEDVYAVVGVLLRDKLLTEVGITATSPSPSASIPPTPPNSKRPRLR